MSETPFKEQFFAGYSVKLQPDAQLLKFLQTQRVDEQTAKNLTSYLHLQYDEHDLLKAATVYWDGEVLDNEHITELLQAENAIGQLKYHELPIHTIDDFYRDENGLHQLGGEVPTGFTLPSAKLTVPFQYLGYIDNTDEAFKWLPFKLHLTCPIYLNFEAVFVDYTNPQSPVLINTEQLENVGSSYDDDLNANSEIVFNEVRFSTRQIDCFGYGLGFSGVPNWIQDPDIPVCPKSNRIMMFVCQLQGDGVTTKHSNVVAHDEWYEQYYNKLNFWGDGDLYVFFEPTSKVACYIIQNT